jgi:1-acyl-sn-glycerol-3-phosphate acyltransferase
MSTPDASSRNKLVAAILEFLVGEDLLAARDIRAELEREIDEAGTNAVLALKAALTTDTGWDYYPRDPLAQGIHHRLADRFLAQGSELRGTHHLTGLTGAPVVVLANHLSYADANVIEVMLQRSGHAELGNRLTALAGPKVFTNRNRRFSSLCFGTVKVPQSTEVSSEEAVLNARDVARAARQSIEVARGRLRSGDALVLFAEGTRSRTGSMQTMLAGVARYLDMPGTWVLPVGLAGSEALLPVEDPTLRPARVVMQVGRPIQAETLLTHAAGDRRLMMDAIGLAIAELVPLEYRGAYGWPERLVDAANVLHDSRQPV